MRRDESAVNQADQIARLHIAHSALAPCFQICCGDLEETHKC
jgi:hypothetical protein